MRPPRGDGRSGGGRFGGDGGRGHFGGGRGRGGGGGYRDEGPPAEVVEVPTFLHSCEGDAVTKMTNEKVPYFNAPIYHQNKTQIGKVDEIFGPINESGKLQMRASTHQKTLRFYKAMKSLKQHLNLGKSFALMQPFIYNKLMQSG